MRNRTSDYGAARVCKGINLRGREAYATVPNILTMDKMHFVLDREKMIVCM